jgi:D-glycero-D-manno-heptose 1,7-bisphosphate phosphatase
MPVRVLFMDRDGTLNYTVRSRPPNMPDEVQLLPGVASVLKQYVADGWQLVIVSNQGGVAGGYISEAQAWAVQQRVVDLLPAPVAASYLCPHMPDGAVTEYAIDCPNRKPRPGFILAALERFGARAEDCLFVGDSITYQQAAGAAGVPFRWADRFFGRPIDRGLHTPGGQWVQVREVGLEDRAAVLELAGRTTESGALPPFLRDGDDGNEASGLVLMASMEGAPVGWLALDRGSGQRTADLAFGVDAAFHDRGIGSLLMEPALAWAREQSGLERLCVQVRAGNLPVTQLCCKFGFVLEGQEAAGAGDGGALATLSCTL